MEIKVLRKKGFPDLDVRLLPLIEEGKPLSTKFVQDNLTSQEKRQEYTKPSTRNKEVAIGMIPQEGLSTFLRRIADECDTLAEGGDIVLSYYIDSDHASDAEATLELDRKADIKATAVAFFYNLWAEQMNRYNVAVRQEREYLELQTRFKEV